MLKRETLDGRARPSGQHPVTWVVLAVAFAGAAVMQVFLAVSMGLWWPLVVAFALAAAAVGCGVQAARCRVKE
jgi:hypothetical protein